MKAMGPIPVGFSSDGTGSLLIGERSVSSLVNERAGTPLFAYDRDLIGRQIARFRAAMPDNVSLHYAVKANYYDALLIFLAQFVDGFDVASAGEIERLAARISEEVGAPPAEVNLGGGFGIPYFPGELPLDVERIGAALGKAIKDTPAILNDTRFAIELGRWLVGEAGVYLTRIVDRKESGGRIFLITNGGLHHVLAASGNFGQLLRRNYPVAIASRFGAEPDEEVTVTGCLCTPLDLLVDQVMLPRADIGDIVAIFCAGAYGLSASPQSFLSQPPAGEMLV